MDSESGNPDGSRDGGERGVGPDDRAPVSLPSVHQDHASSIDIEAWTDRIASMWSPTSGMQQNIRNLSMETRPRHGAYGKGPLTDEDYLDAKRLSVRKGLSLVLREAKKPQRVWLDDGWVGQIVSEADALTPAHVKLEDCPQCGGPMTMYRLKSPSVTGAAGYGYACSVCLPPSGTLAGIRWNRLVKEELAVAPRPAVVDAGHMLVPARDLNLDQFQRWLAAEAIRAAACALLRRPFRPGTDDARQEVTLDESPASSDCQLTNAERAELEAIWRMFVEPLPDYPPDNAGAWADPPMWGPEDPIERRWRTQYASAHQQATEMIRHFLAGDTRGEEWARRRLALGLHLSRVRTQQFIDEPGEFSPYLTRKLAAGLIVYGDEEDAMLVRAWRDLFVSVSRLVGEDPDPANYFKDLDETDEQEDDDERVVELGPAVPELTDAQAKSMAEWVEKGWQVFPRDRAALRRLQEDRRLHGEGSFTVRDAKLTLIRRVLPSVWADQLVPQEWTPRNSDTPRQVIPKKLPLADFQEWVRDRCIKAVRALPDEESSEEFATYGTTRLVSRRRKRKASASPPPPVDGPLPADPIELYRIERDRREGRVTGQSSEGSGSKPARRRRIDSLGAYDGARGSWVGGLEMRGDDDDSTGATEVDGWEFEQGNDSGWQGYGREDSERRFSPGARKLLNRMDELTGDSLVQKEILATLREIGRFDLVETARRLGRNRSTVGVQWGRLVEKARAAELDVEWLGRPKPGA